MKRTNKPIKNYQKKKYYLNRNIKPKVYKTKKPDPWLDGTFAVDPHTFEVKHIPNK